MNRYFKLIYISILSALFLMGLSSILNNIQVDPTLGLVTLVVLTTIQLTIYAKAEYVLLKEVVQTLQVRFSFNLIVIPFKKERKDYIPSFFMNNNRFLLQVIRC